MFVLNITGGDVFLHEINAKIPKGDGIYQIPDHLKENYPQLTRLPGSIVKKLDDRAMAIELAEKRIEELEEKLKSKCVGRCGHHDEPINELKIPITSIQTEITVKRGRGRPFKAKT